MEGATGAESFQFASARLDGDRIGVVWSPPLADPTLQMDVHWRILDASGAPQGGPGVLPAVSQLVADLEIAPAGAGFRAFVQSFFATGRVLVARIGALAVGADGVATGGLDPIAERSITTVSPSTGETTGPAGTRFSVDGGPDGHAVGAYDTAIAGGAEIKAVGR